MGSFPLSHPLTSGRNTPTNLPDIFCPANVGNRFFGQEGTKHNKKIQDASTYLVPQTSTTLKWLLDDSKLWPCWNFSCSNMQHVNLSWTWFKLGWYVNKISCWINKKLSWLPKITTTETVENVETLHMFPAELVIENCTLKNRYKLRELNQTWHRSVHWTFVRQKSSSSSSSSWSCCCLLSLGWCTPHFLKPQQAQQEMIEFVAFTEVKRIQHWNSTILSRSYVLKIARIFPFLRWIRGVTF